MRNIASIQDSVGTLKSVGPKRAEALQQLGVYTIEDLLLHFPFRYQDVQTRDLHEILDQEKVSLKGVVLTEPVVTYFRPKMNRLVFKMAVSHHVITVVFFNQPYLKSRIEQQSEVVIYGKWDEKKQQLLGMKVLDSTSDHQFSAVYHTNQSIKQSTWIQLIEQALPLYLPLVEEMLPAFIIEENEFMSYSDMIQNMHFPSTLEAYQQARRRMIYQELFLYQLRLLHLKKERYQEPVLPFHYDNKKLKEYVEMIPFELTSAQKRVANEICRDLLLPFAMNRLLQGDVGSGKTVVASIAIFASMLSNYQSALMVPTEILAQQHFKTLANLFENTPLKVGLLTSSTKPKERRLLLEQVANGDIHCLIGTHALIQEDVQYQKLGLVIIDEQHRFGVQQRQLLKQKASVGNVLYMSATPIPRTLSMTVFGEMDVSIIDELPAGRQEIQTKWVKDTEVEQVLQFIQEQVKCGRQAYVITPLIEESEAIDLKNAQETFAYMQDWFGESCKIALLHGKMKPQEKEEIMVAFSNNTVQVLISTTVIEVGVNVPNATIMVIQDAERFGLSQLHQLRGRVGRGEYQSYCILVATPKTENGKKRMKIMTESTDGFYLSQKDLEMRGAGDIFGVRQSGVPVFKCADIVADAQVLLQASHDAHRILQDKQWEAKVNQLLRSMTFDKIGNK